MRSGQLEAINGSSCSTFHLAIYISFLKPILQYVLKPILRHLSSFYNVYLTLLCNVFWNISNLWYIRFYIHRSAKLDLNYGDDEHEDDDIIMNIKRRGRVKCGINRQCMPQMKSLVQLFSTQKCINRDKTEFATKQRKSQENQFFNKSTIIISGSESSFILMAFENQEKKCIVWYNQIYWSLVQSDMCIQSYKVEQISNNIACGV